MPKRTPLNSIATERPRLKRSIDEVRLKLVEIIRVGENWLAHTPTTRSDLDAQDRECRIWHAFNRDYLRMVFTNDEESDRYSRAGMGAAPALLGPTLTEQRKLEIEVKTHVDWLRAKLMFLEGLNGRLETFELVDVPTSSRATLAAVGGSVFIVHGHDGEAKEAVAGVLGKLGLDPVILHEKPNYGRTVIEKLVAEGNGVGFAVVLLTPDDVGGTSEATLGPRARQNVILELGYFIALLGRERVVPLVRGNVETPSDIAGVVYEPFDAAGHWKFTLVRELKACGYEVDANRLLGVRGSE
ncbi:MAG: TIR domain-containing protein [Tepidiformaceae bacterium]